MPDVLSLIICFGLIFFYFFVGRLLATYTLFGRVFASSALYNTFTAMGMWYFLGIIAAVLSVPLKGMWWLFVGLCLVGYLFSLTARQEKLPREHSLTVPVVMLIFLFPIFYFIVGDVATQTQEWLGLINNSDYITQLGKFPAGEEAATHGLQYLPEGQATLISVLPSFLVGGLFFENSFAIIHVILLAFVADCMMKLTDLNIRWSNVALVAVGSIFALTLINPFFSFYNLVQANDSLFLAAAILVAMVPLCREKPLPLGLAILPMGFVLALLTGFGAAGEVAVVLILSLYFLRFLFEQKTWVESVFALVVLAALPLLASSIWSIYSQEVALYLPLLNNANGFDITWQGTAAALQILFLTVVVVFALVQILSVRSYADFKGLFLQHAWVVMPTLFVCGYIFVARQQGFAVVQAIQFIVMVPFWYMVTSWYKGSKWRTLAYDSPWVLALSLGVIFMSAQALFSEKLTQRYTDPQLHTLSIARKLVTGTFAGGENVAVLEGDVQQKGGYAALLRWGLTKHKGQVVAVDNLLHKSAQDIGLFHLNLKNAGFNYLWLHAPTESDKKLLGGFLKGDRSYLFEVRENSLRLVEVFPHLSYDYKSVQ